MRTTIPSYVLLAFLMSFASCMEAQVGNNAFWHLQGNRGTTPPATFLGTTDGKPLVFKTGGIERMRIGAEGNVGIGATAPGEKLHIGDGNALLEGGGETAVMFKRDATFVGVSGTSANPIFKIGRIIQAGDGDPEFRVLYSDDATAERSVIEFDRKGIVASVKPEVGSHFEGFIAGDQQPLFRLNSFPSMRLEMGPGGLGPTDVAVSRANVATLAFQTANNEWMRITASGNVGIGTTAPAEKLDVNGNVRAANFIAGGTTLNVPDYVFSDSYSLMSLDTLRGYLAREKRLPNVPSAAEIQRKGLDIGQFQMKLLEKIEELTLHVLDQQETIQTQRARLEALETRLGELMQGQR